MSSGCGTQQNDSKDEPTYAESLEMQPLNYPSTSNENDSEMLVLNADGLASTATAKMIDSSSIGNEYQHRRKTSTPTYGGDSTKNSILNNPFGHMSPMSRSSNAEQRKNDSRNICGNIRRLSSDQSINSISNDHDDMFTQPNLRDELLSCDQKELFQFLNDDFDNSLNYFSDTVGFGSALIDPDTDSLLMFDAKRDANIFSPGRKASTASNKSNLSCISNSIFEALEHTRGGSISESVDRQRKAAAAAAAGTYSHSNELEPLVQDSEFENIIASFEKELSIIKNSTNSLHRQWSRAYSEDSNNKGAGNIGAGSGGIKQHSFELSSSTHTYEEILPMRLNSTNNSNTNNSNKNSNRNSVNLKRRSLEKQMKVDDDFNVSNELKKICDHIQAPFTDSGSTDTKKFKANINMNNSKNELSDTNANDGNSSSNNKIRTAATGVTSTTGKGESIGTFISSTNNLCSISPKVRRKSDFHSSFDRMKRTSLIERVDESMQEDQLHHASSAAQLPSFEQQTRSEKMPRKHLNTDMNLDSLSLKSTGSYEHLVCHREKEPKKIRFEKRSDDTMNASSEPGADHAIAKNVEGGGDGDGDKGITFMIIQFKENIYNICAFLRKKRKKKKQKFNDNARSYRLNFNETKWHCK